MTTVDSPDQISVTFVGHASRLMARGMLNLQLLRGQKPIGITDDKKLVKGSGLYGLETIGHRVLTLGGEEN
ncbi:MAG: hypothetical protein AAF988_03270 [Pseudomonadota bacterium]